MYFGVDYYPEQWVYPYAGRPDEPETQWEHDAELMAEAGINLVRMGEFTWGLCEPEEGKYEFDWLRRAMDIMAKAGIKTVLCTPTAAPPIWLAQKHPEILAVDERGLIRREGTRRGICLNSELYWEAAKKIVRAMAQALGNHHGLVAWQIDTPVGSHYSEESFNEDTRRDWHWWLEQKYQTIEQLNNLLGLRHWGQVVTDWKQVPMPMHAPAGHNPALVLDWHRFCSDTIVQFVKEQADLLRELTPKCPITTNLRPFTYRFDHFDIADVIDFVSVEGNVTAKIAPAEVACETDMLRSVKKSNIRTPDGSLGFWVIEQKAGAGQELNPTIRPGLLRLLAYQMVARGADAILFLRWRPPRFGSEKFQAAVLPHHIRRDNRVYREVAQVGEELRLLAPAIKGTRVVAETCILFTHDNDWAMHLTGHPNKHLKLRDHIQLFYNALHSRNIPVDFARPTDDLSKYKVVFAPSLYLLAGGEADRLKLYVQNGGVLVATCNTGLVDEHNIAPDNGYPHDMTDLFGLEVIEFDPLPPAEENHMVFKGTFPATHMHPARLWCDIIEPKGCDVVATFAKDFYAGRPALTINNFGDGKAIYIGTVSHQYFYDDLVTWLRQFRELQTPMKTPTTVEVSVREKDDTKIFFMLNHQNAPVRIQFQKPMHDFLTATVLAGNYDMPPYGVLVLEERAPEKTAETGS